MGHEKLVEKQNFKEKDLETLLPDVVNDEEVSVNTSEHKQLAGIVAEQKKISEMLTEAIVRTPSSFARKRTKKIKVIIDE